MPNNNDKFNYDDDEDLIKYLQDIKNNPLTKSDDESIDHEEPVIILDNSDDNDDEILPRMDLFYSPDSQNQYNQDFETSYDNINLQEDIQNLQQIRINGKDEQVIERFGKYYATEKIGEGGFGSVYKAWDQELERFVVIKSIPLNETDAYEEAKKIAKFNHPNIIEILDAGKTSAKAYYVMNYYQNTPNLIEFCKRKSESQKLNLLIGILDGLIEIHKNKLVHNDLKPQNILVQEETPAIIDFGLTGAKNETPTSKTPLYCSPEQADKRKTDKRSDIFCFGSIAYWILTNKHAFKVPEEKGKRKGGDSEIFGTFANLINRKELKRPKEIPKPLWAMIQKCWEEEPENRYNTARKLQDDVKKYMNDEPVSCYKENIIEKGSRLGKKHMKKILLGLTATAVLTTGYFYNENVNSKEQAEKAKSEQLYSEAEKIFNRWADTNVNKLKEAQRLLRKSYKLNPNWKTMALFARTYGKQGSEAMFLKFMNIAYKKALKDKTPQPDLLVTSACALMENDRKKAKGLLFKAKKQGSKIAHVLIKNINNEELTQKEQETFINSDLWEMQLEIGAKFMTKGEHKQAIKLFERALRNVPRNKPVIEATIRYNIALSLCKQKDTTLKDIRLALIHASEANRLQPNDSEIKIVLNHIERIIYGNVIRKYKKE